MPNRTYFLEYLASLRIASKTPQLVGVANEFYSLLMAACRFADSDNMSKIEEYWPDLVIDLRTRYNAPGGATTEAERRFLVSMDNIPDEEEE